jgi:hypothetical protein
MSHGVGFRIPTTNVSCRSWHKREMDVLFYRRLLPFFLQRITKLKYSLVNERNSVMGFRQIWVIILPHSRPS